MIAKKKIAESTFETDLAHLEALAEQMEQGELPLDDLMAAYEEGAKLVKTLRGKLNRAKAKLHEVKTDSSGEWTVTPLLTDEEESRL